MAWRWHEPGSGFRTHTVTDAGRVAREGPVSYAETMVNDELPVNAFQILTGLQQFADFFFQKANLVFPLVPICTCHTSDPLKKVDQRINVMVKVAGY